MPESALPRRISMTVFGQGELLSRTTFGSGNGDGFWNRWDLSFYDKEELPFGASSPAPIFRGSPAGQAHVCPRVPKGTCGLCCLFFQHHDALENCMLGVC